MQSCRFSFESMPDGYPAIYEVDATENTASTNAGDYRLYVGGGSINWAFGDLFTRHQGLWWEGKMCLPYQMLHEAALQKSLQTDGRLCSMDRDEMMNDDGALLLPSLGLAACFCCAGEIYPGEEGRFAGAIGSIFVDIFEEEKRPLNAKKVAMLYAVGPKGLGCSGPQPLLDKSTFLKALEALGRRSLETVAAYNAIATHQGLPLIEKLRWCLVSGGVYRHGDVSKIEVARATLRGMKAAEARGFEVIFAYDEDVFADAWRLETEQS